MDPQGTEVAPQGTAVAPQGTAVAPQGTAVAPKRPPTIAPPPEIKSTPKTSEKLLSSGSEAEVFLTTFNGKKCAMKLYRKGFGPNKKVAAQLEQLKGRGLVTDVLATGTRDGRKYEIMPYYPLGSLADYDFRGNAKAIMSVILRAAMILDECHKAGIVHKDVKPANFLVVNDKTWEIALGDFGIADVLEDGMATTGQARTPIYAAPEIYDPDNVYARIDGRDIFLITGMADYYSLGMTALSLWWGEKKFNRDEANLVRLKQMDGLCGLEEMPDDLSDLVSGLLHSDPDERWGIKEIQGMFGSGESGRWRFMFKTHPLSDVRMNSDIGSPDYIKTPQQMGKFLSEVYTWFYNGGKAPADKAICRAVEKSFEQYEDSYLAIYFESAGSVWEDWPDWAEACADGSYTPNGKIAYNDKRTRSEIAMMKAATGMIGDVPPYIFADTGTSISSLEEYRDVKNFPGSREKALDCGLRGWLALHLQENLYEDFSEKYTYEKKLAQYVGELEFADSKCDESRLFHHAETCAKFSSYDLQDRLDKFRGKTVFYGFLTILLLIPAAVLFFAQLSSAIAHPGVSDAILDHKWIFVVLGGIVFVAIMGNDLWLALLAGAGVATVSYILSSLICKSFMWIFFALTAALIVVLLMILVKILLERIQAPSSSEYDIDFETGTLEPVDYAIKNARQRGTGAGSANEAKFISSFDHMGYNWEGRLKYMRKCLLGTFIALVVLGTAAFFLPKSEGVSAALGKVKAKIESVIPDKTTSTSDEAATE